ncbi:MAG: hypothetical protein SFU84_12585 [Gemmatimonadales bacterium]|nr:hypothetical protein [Gemmatimonadales bacterium]
MSVCRHFLLFGVLPILVTAVEAQTMPPRRVFTMGGNDGVVFPDVIAAARSGARTIVLSTPAPAVHARTDAGMVQTWGRAGDGPGEYRDPIDLTWGATGGLILDQNAHRLTAYDAAGRLLWARPTGTDWANRVRIVLSDTLLHVFEPMGARRAVVRVRGASRDTIVRYAIPGARIHLEGTSGPSFTLWPPFVPTTQWTDVPGVGIALWRPGDKSVRVQTVSGAAVALLPLPSAPVAVASADREWWFSKTFGVSFAGRRNLFSGLIPEARRRVEFPAQFPLVNELLASPGGTIWVRRSSAGSGQEWLGLHSSGGAPRRIVLPPGREAIAFGDDVVLTRGVSADDEPIVEGWMLR